MAKILLRHCPILTRTTSYTLYHFKIGRFNKLPVIKSTVLQNIFAATTPQRLYSGGRPIIIVDYAAVKKSVNEPNKLLIDVREPKELQETGQIPSSINIPLGIVSQELAANAQHFKSKYARDKPQPDTELIFHCKSGVRSLKAAEAAVALGFTNVNSYEGSWLDWAKHEGLPK